MNKVFLAIILVLSLVGCKQQPKEEYIPLLEDNGDEYYIATPSGIVYVKASGSDVIEVWHDANNETRNIYEVEDVRKDK